MRKAIFYGILSSVFFALTFLLNKTINLSGGYWMWSSSLRYIFMLLILYIMILRQNSIKKVLNLIKGNTFTWIIWSTVGFGFFYVPLTFASTYGESWLVAGCWQITIIAGIILTPLFKNKVPLISLSMSSIILIGVFLIQFEQASNFSFSKVILTITPILIAAFAYPLGNRKMMHICENTLTATERVFGMTLCSMPFWIIISFIAYIKSGLPSANQISQSIVVAIFAGVIATVLFFKATDLVKSNSSQLAIIEATQSGEVIFTILGEILILGGEIPSIYGIIGFCFIILGMILNSIVPNKLSKT